MAFWKPGAPKPEAPLSLEARAPPAAPPLRQPRVADARFCSCANHQVDRQGGGDFATLVAFNPNDALGLTQQRQRLPAFKARLSGAFNVCARNPDSAL